MKRIRIRPGVFFRHPVVRVILLAVVLSIVNFGVIYFPLVPERYNVIAWARNLKRWVQEDDRGAERNRARIARELLLLDVSNDFVTRYDQEKVDSLMIPADEEEPPMGPFQSDYDLQKLTCLFKWLATHDDQYHMVVCNLYLDGLQRSPATDSLLGYIIRLVQQNKIIFAALYDPQLRHFRQYPDSTYFEKYIPPTHKGAVNEELVDDRFYRYQLSYDGGHVKALPLLMLERINGFSVEPGTGLHTYRRGGTVYDGFNTFMPEMIFSTEDLDSIPSFGVGNGLLGDTVVGKMELWQSLILFDGKENYHLTGLLKNAGAGKRSIIIDAFTPSNSGMHKTLYGDMSGGMVLLNIYYNLLFRENSLDYWHLFFSVAFFCWIAWWLLYPPAFLKATPRVLPLAVLVAIFLEEIHLWLLIVMTILTNWIFDRDTHVLVLAFLLVVIDKTLEARRKIREKKESAGAASIQPPPAMQPVPQLVPTDKKP